MAGTWYPDLDINRNGFRMIKMLATAVEIAANVPVQLDVDNNAIIAAAATSRVFGVTVATIAASGTGWVYTDGGFLIVTGAAGAIVIGVPVAMTDATTVETLATANDYVVGYSYKASAGAASDAYIVLNSQLQSEMQHG